MDYIGAMNKRAGLKVNPRFLPKIKKCGIRPWSKLGGMFSFKHHEFVFRHETLLRHKFSFRRQTRRWSLICRFISGIFLES